MPAPGRPASLILDTYGHASRAELGHWMPVAGLVELMGHVGLDAPAVRSAIARMKRRGLVTGTTRAGRRGYLLTDEAIAIVSEGNERIFAVRRPADLRDGWVLVVFSVPEAQRGQRHLLRSRLERLGFGNQAPGVWIAPRRLAGDAERLIATLGLTRFAHLYEARYRGFAEATDLVRASWDLDRLEALYEAFIARHEATAARWADDDNEPDERAAFVDYVTLAHGWRRFPYLDPGLPAEVLPRDWPGARAAHVFFELADRLETPALRFLARAIAPVAA